MQWLRHRKVGRATSHKLNSRCSLIPASCVRILLKHVLGPRMTNLVNKLRPCTDHAHIPISIPNETMLESSPYTKSTKPATCDQLRGWTRWSGSALDDSPGHSGRSGHRFDPVPAGRVNEGAWLTDTLRIPEAGLSMASENSIT